ncbi:hypothetical protein [Brasilonema sp. UFV-L1]|uniref:hypothetical protein n=1 Tax=Brasilonema sp. UFV-L1 TaxID=2234130 RepID=UPI00145F73CA|nr:hypothetical protein [Brasilonema sp. UFV-L1]NMG05691.1 hypothetical protein [Brasilonema sp. UFV-L1]
MEQNLSSLTLSLASEDIRRVLDKQKEERQILLTQTNILFVVNSALLSVLTIARLISVFSLFSITEIVLFLINFTLLINALLPRQFVITPNPENEKFLEGYLAMSPEEYQLQMLVNLVETYNANKQPLNDISQSLFYAAGVTWGIALVGLLHVVAVYFIPQLRQQI